MKIFIKNLYNKFTINFSMKQKLLKLISSIKDDLKQIENEGTYHPLIDSVWESLAEMEDEIYDDEDEDGIDISDYME